MVGGVAIPPAQGTFMGFAAGARAVNPDVRVLETFIGNWNDVAAAKEATVAQLRQGADVIIHNTDAASFGVFQAIREAVEAGGEVWAMGMNRDQNDVAPEVILGSAAIDIPRAFLSVAREWQAGELRGAPVFAGAAEGVVDLILNPALQDRIPAELQARVQAARDSVIAGTLDVPRVPFVEGQDPNGIEVVGSR
jgi:basic membrane lipoprotein Med (substrate-binding protein (PBP1-ABC) superfamily)